MIEIPNGMRTVMQLTFRMHQIAMQPRKKAIMVELLDIIRISVFEAVKKSEIRSTRRSGRLVTFTHALVPLVWVMLMPVVVSLTLSLLIPK